MKRINYENKYTPVESFGTNGMRYYSKGNAGHYSGSHYRGR